MNPKEIVERYNQYINERNLEKLAMLMSEEYVFIDTAGTRIEGKEVGKETWKKFFEQFPDYRNIFETIEERGDSVVVTGRSVCSAKQLNGPALWKAKTKNGKILEWQVFEDTANNRKLIDIN